MGRSILFTIFTAFYFVLFLTRVHAAQLPTEPTFPSCLNPQGALLIDYPSGVHGIVGDSGVYSGSDKVYKITEFSLTQCFCSTNGDGIQTNWWKTGSLSEDQIIDLKRLGWYFIPDGSLWGLEKTYYMAKNTDFSCGSNNSLGDNDTGTGGGVLGDSTPIGQVLGLATTGNLDIGLLSLTLGVGLLVVSRSLRQK